MTPDDVRLALGQEEARTLLTPHQRRVLELLAEEAGNVSAVARRLDVSRVAVRKSMRLAAQKLAEFGRLARSPEGD